MARMTASEALRRLTDGNRRFVSGTPRTSFPRRPELLHGQDPFAVVLGCSDSRVPVEIVFDQGPGDLFVVRVAGHVALPALLGSLEIAVAQLEPSLVVVLGHQGCAAVRLTLKALNEPIEGVPENAVTIAEHIRPSVEGLTEEASLDDAVRAHVRGTVGDLREEVPDATAVVGAFYSLETGVVEWLDD